MSGPKVVRIVTREEIVARCEDLLARLEAVAARWQRVGRRNSTIDAADIAAVEARRKALRALLEGDRFDELQKEVPAEIAFLDNDEQLRLRQAAIAASDARRDGRRLARTAETLLTALAAAHINVPEDLRRELLQTGTRGVDGEACCARAFALLHGPANSPAITDHQRRLADSLGQGERRVSFADWQATQPPIQEDPVVCQIDRAIADLVVLAGENVATPFQTRAATLNTPAAAPTRNLLADSLLIDLATELTHRRADARALAQLEELAAALAQYTGVATRELHSKADAAITAGDASQAKALTDSIRQALSVEQQALAVTARRQAVLKGLAELGYEVADGMATASAEAGRVVLRAPAQPGYGVEIGGVTGDRMQLRPVALGSATTERDHVRDRDIETLWCRDVARLTTLLSEHGDTLTIEKAVPIGATPLKTIAMDDSPASVENVAGHRRVRQD